MLNTNNTLGNTNNEYFEFYFYNKKNQSKIKDITKKTVFCGIASLNRESIPSWHIGI